jgi:hypothetical protein
MLTFMKRIVAAVIVVLTLCTAGASNVSDIHRAGFVYARIRYHMLPYGRIEVPWHHDYPYGDELFPSFIKQRTNVDANHEAYQIVDIDSKDLFKYPFAYLCEPGFLDLLPEDVVNLKNYLDRGGFLLVDDFRGQWHFENLRVQMKKVYPDRDFVPLDVHNPIFHSFFDIDTLDMVPPYGSNPVEFWALLNAKGDVQMIINYNNDLSEIWEWLDKGEMSLRESVTALQLGTNYLIYAMTH